MGGKYAEGAISQSDTLAGKLSTLQDNIQRLAQNIGRIMTPVFNFLLDNTSKVIKGINQIITAGQAAAFTREAVFAQSKINLLGPFGVQPGIGDIQALVDRIQGNPQKNAAGSRRRSKDCREAGCCCPCPWHVDRRPPERQRH